MSGAASFETQGYHSQAPRTRHRSSTHPYPRACRGAKRLASSLSLPLPLSLAHPQRGSRPSPSALRRLPPDSAHAGLGIWTEEGKESLPGDGRGSSLQDWPGWGPCAGGTEPKQDKTFVAGPCGARRQGRKLRAGEPLSGLPCGGQHGASSSQGRWAETWAWPGGRAAACPVDATWYRRPPGRPPGRPPEGRDVRVTEGAEGAAARLKSAGEQLQGLV